MALNLLSSFESLTHATSFISSIASLSEAVGSNYVKDENVRNALIDTAIEYLTSLKTTPKGQ